MPTLSNNTSHSQLNREQFRNLLNEEYEDFEQEQNDSEKTHHPTKINQATLTLLKHPIRSENTEDNKVPSVIKIVTTIVVNIASLVAASVLNITKKS